MPESTFFRLLPRFVFDTVNLVFDQLLHPMIGEIILIIVVHKPIKLMYDKCSRDSRWRLGHTTHKTGLCTHFYLPESDSRRILNRQKADIHIFICPLSP